MTTPMPFDREDHDAILYAVLLPQLIAYRDSLVEDVPELSGLIALLKLLARETARV